MITTTAPTASGLQVLPSVSVVIPLLNEHATIRPLYDRLLSVLRQVASRHEIIFVDDGSTDGSQEIIREIQASDRAVRYIFFRRNFGKSAALAAGMRMVKFEIITTIDADLQDIPEQLPLLLGKMEEGYDLVSAWRYDRQDSFSRKTASRIYNKITSLLTGVRLHDINCGFKCYRREVLKDVMIYGERHRFIPVLASYRGFRLGEVRVKHSPRVSGKSRYGLERIFGGIFSLLSVILMTRYTNKPLHFFGIIGFLLAGLGSIIELYLTVERILYQRWLTSRPLFLLGAIFLVIGVQVISFGLLAEMIAFSYRREDDYSIIESSDVSEELVADRGAPGGEAGRRDFPR
jgi:glycosyltransferase involved in cell wall biosynthesis